MLGVGGLFLIFLGFFFFFSCKLSVLYSTFLFFSSDLFFHFLFLRTQCMISCLYYYTNNIFSFVSSNSLSFFLLIYLSKVRLNLYHVDYQLVLHLNTHRRTLNVFQYNGGASSIAWPRASPGAWRIKDDVRRSKQETSSLYSLFLQTRSKKKEGRVKTSHLYTRYW